MSKAPSAFHIQQALSVWHSARARIGADNEHDQAELEALLGAETDDVETIIVRLLRAAREAEVMAKGATEMMGDLAERRARFAKRAQDARATAFAVMTALGRDKIETEDVTASIKAGQPRVVIVDEDAIPEIYVYNERKIDRATIGSVLKSGGTVNGAQLSNSLPTLSIRTR